MKPYTAPAITYEIDTETNAGSPLPPPGGGCLGPAPYPLPASEILRACGAMIYNAYLMVRVLLGRW